MKVAFLKLFWGISRLGLVLGDLFVGAIAFALARVIFDLLSSVIHRPPIAPNVAAYFMNHAMNYLSLFVLVNYLASSFKIAFDRPRKLGWFSLLLTSLFFLVWLCFWMETQGFPLKTFFVFAFFILWGAMYFWRVILPKILTAYFKTVNWQDWAPSVLLRNAPRIKQYFQEKPAAVFIIVFMVLLAGCTFLLLLKKDVAAEKLANWAYFSLVIGVVLELAYAIRHRDENLKDNAKADHL